MRHLACATLSGAQLAASIIQTACYSHLYSLLTPLPVCVCVRARAFLKLSWIALCVHESVVELLPITTVNTPFLDACLLSISIEILAFQSLPNLPISPPFKPPLVVLDYWLLAHSFSVHSSPVSLRFSTRTQSSY